MHFTEEDFFPPLPDMAESLLITGNPGIKLEVFIALENPEIYWISSYSWKMYHFRHFT